MDPSHAILFEPVKIGPVTAPNRFYQTPHATGFGWQRPQSGAALRKVKAEGGWGVVCTEYCSIHPSSDDSPHAFLTLWDDGDIAPLALTAAAIHDHGALAGIELWHGGAHASNRMTRLPTLAPRVQPALYHLPSTARAMDRADIRAFRLWQREAALRAKRAGFDIIYVYAGHDYLPFQFLSARTNDRGDAYGGSLENRARLLREMLEDTKEAVGDTCAVAVRLAVDELQGPQGVTSEAEGREVVELLAEIPDLWDVNIAGALGNDSKSARFSEEGFQEDYIRFVKGLTSKPVVSVGRFTSPDRMVSQIRRGIQDFIGAARPSIADPFLPAKIREGRADEIRECIGCNICRAANNEAVGLRCTQNPTMGEEWRRGWHPERVPPAKREKVLVVGGGPAGLEAALTLARRGLEVHLAEKARQFGGRVNRESTLPGLATWGRVRDHRLHMLGKTDATLYPESEMTAQDIRDFGAAHVVIATGSVWRRDGMGVCGMGGAFPAALTPDDIFAGADPGGDVVIYDDEHYFMAGALAERLATQGRRVTYVTPQAQVSTWTAYTDEQGFIQARLMGLGVRIVTGQVARSWDQGLHSVCTYTGREAFTPAETLILCTGRLPVTGLYDQLQGLPGLALVGDALQPSSMADAIHSAHRFAREIDGPQPLRREMPGLGS
ncbi:FAD-dependent oxidoreductase [Rhodobacter sp. KR11]|uniref:oxidoreductase n=1 Tax=Rhodobacter sp. KR11 TaxID=2974588 RepID=UPI0022215A81|nr:FAD-dependent oxidoreductase [Rhodobacter sp. KR11]MCW1917317.1 FAD-dependent oxidoreductase [Rhodobacter sp. KR11]